MLPIGNLPVGNLLISNILIMNYWEVIKYLWRAAISLRVSSPPLYLYFKIELIELILKL